MALHDLKAVNENTEITVVNDALVIDLKLCHFHFQPIFSLLNDSICMYEALLRVDDMRFNSIENVVVNLIEAGRSDELTLFTLASITPYLHSPKYKEKIFTLNFDPCQLASDRFIDIIVNFFKSNSLHPSRVMFELTERPCSDAIFFKLICNANRLVNIGFDFAIDDFGTGIANFQLLTKLQAKLLKLDGTFGMSALNSKTSKAILGIASTFRDNFDCSVCIEGLETNEHIALAKQMRFCYGQGYGLERPAELRL
ncbi:EAL domain-containing protein [uncultured Pseudoalteromonas sp.]|uniref:EAL domain-containing protein n=1 Tax=uncultured Pseudoalteromonas sp. TaxID=114053 RepID=UPI0025990827|nr:EAL domain-containing protein [uncultured Pseudoalteromonas sp.]